MTVSPSAAQTSFMHVLCPACRKLNRVSPERLSAQPSCGSCHRPLFAGHPVEVDEAQFQAHVRQDELPLLVDMWAPWCGPCRMMAPHFERAATLLEPHVRLLKLDTDQAQATANHYSIRSIPTLLLIHRGRVVDRASGAQSAEALVRWVRSHSL